MKKTILITNLLLAAFGLSAIESNEAETRQTFAWTLAYPLGTLSPAEVDTLDLNFQDAAPDLRAGIAADFLGNLGSPVQSKEYFRRTDADGYRHSFLFAIPYDAYLLTPQDQLYFDTRTPYTNISYFTGGPSGRGEDRFKALFTVNASPDLNFGFDADYLYGRGIYMNQATNHFLGSLFGSYRSQNYSAFLTADFNNLRNRENGGITDPRYITHPETMGDGQGKLSPENIEVNLNNTATSRLDNFALAIHQRYALTAATLAYTLLYETTQKRFTEETPEQPFYRQMPDYANLYLNNEQTDDEARLTTFANTFALSLNETFNRFARFGLTAFVENRHQTYAYIKNATLAHHAENNTALGAQLAKREGARFRYEATAKLGVAGTRAADFDLSGDVWSNIPFWSDSVQFSAATFIRNSTPDYFLERYESNHVRWDNSFSKTFNTRLEGRLAFPAWRAELRAHVENLTNHIYFNTGALPQQVSKSIQILAFGAVKNFRLGRFYFEHEALYQFSGNQEAIPLPAWLLKANYYYRNRFFNVLTIQLGAEARYFSRYYAPAYMPPIGQFYAQITQQVGDYPYLNLYANIHLKRARFFVMYSHANYGISTPDYFLLPNYPANPAMLKIGLSWNFYD